MLQCIPVKSFDRMLASLHYAELELKPRRPRDPILPPAAQPSRSLPCKPCSPPRNQSPLSLPTSKTLTLPTPGHIGSTNGFSATIALSPDGHYAALLNDGYGTQETIATQSIAILDLKTNELKDFPDKRFGEEAKQSYFLGLVFSSDGKHLYASVGSISDPTGAKPPNTGNGIAVYSFTDGQSRTRALHPHRTAAPRRREKSRHRFAKNSRWNRNPLSRGLYVDFFRRP